MGAWAWAWAGVRGRLPWLCASGGAVTPTAAGQAVPCSGSRDHCAGAQASSTSVEEGTSEAVVKGGKGRRRRRIKDGRGGRSQGEDNNKINPRCQKTDESRSCAGTIRPSADGRVRATKR